MPCVLYGLIFKRIRKSGHFLIYILLWMFILDILYCFLLSLTFPDICGIHLRGCNIRVAKDDLDGFHVGAAAYQVGCE